MTTKEEALERGRKLYAEIFDSPFSEYVLDILDGSDIDNILFAIFYDAVQEGYVMNMTDTCLSDTSPCIVSPDGSPIYVISAIRLRTFMCASLTVGMWHQKITDSLDTMWKVDKNSE